MRGQMPLALFAILLGTVDTAAGLQEVVYLGILQSQTEPLIMGALGTVGSGLVLAAGIALLVHSRLTEILVPAAAYVSVPVFILVGVIKHYAAWPSTIVGIAFPLFMLLVWHKFGKPAQALSKT